MAAVKHRQTSRHRVIGSTATPFGQLVEVSMTGSQFERVQVACISPGIPASNFQLNASGARALAEFLAKAAEIAILGERQRLEAERFPVRRSGPKRAYLRHRDET